MGARTGVYSEQVRAIQAEPPIGARLRSPEERRELAHDMLSRNGYTATGERDANGAMIYRRDFTRSSFAVLTLAHNGKPIAVNPERVLHVTTWDNDDATSIVLTHGDPIRVRESVAEAVGKLDAVTSGVAA